MVKIHYDGRVELGPDVEVDDAARQFWDAVERYARSWGLSRVQREERLAAALRAAGVPAKTVDAIADGA